MKKKKKKHLAFSALSATAIAVVAAPIAGAAEGLQNTDVAPLANIQNFNGFAGGSGTEADPYQITNKEQLELMRSNLTSHFILMNDIDLGNQVWVPIGDGTTKDLHFTGSFDGQNHKIKNFKLNAIRDGFGFFGYIKGNASIKNVTFENATVFANDFSEIGTVAGVTDDNTIIENVKVIGKNSISDAVKQGNNLGGIIGYAKGDTILKKLYYKGSIRHDVTSSTTNAIGGIAGKVDSRYQGAATELVADVDIYAPKSKKVGGIIGDKIGAIENAIFSGSIEAFGYVGGIAGEISSTSSTTSGSKKSYNISEHLISTGEVIASEDGTTTTGKTKYTGGLVGYTTGTITIKDSFALNSKIEMLNPSGVGVTGKLVGKESTSSSASATGVVYDKILGNAHSTGVIGTIAHEDLKQGSVFEKYRLPIGNGVWSIEEGKTLPYLSFYPESASSGENIGEGTDSNGFAGGSGTEVDPYQIKTAEQLELIRTNLTSHFILMKDIDLQGKVWEPIGNGKTTTLHFIGSFNGQNHTIKNFKLNATQDGYGFFGYTKDNALIKNVTIENVSIHTNDFSEIGTVVGVADGNTIIKNVIVKGDNTISGAVKKGNNIGGVVGYAKGNSDLKKLYYKGSIDHPATSTTTNAIGGIVGKMDSRRQGSASELVADVNISAPYAKKVGGIVGDKIGAIENAIFNGRVEAFGYVGGIVGEMSSSTGSYNISENLISLGEVISNADGTTTTGKTKYTGGIAAYTSGTITIKNSFALNSKIQALNPASMGVTGKLVGKESTSSSASVTGVAYDKISGNAHSTGVRGTMTDAELKQRAVYEKYVLPIGNGVWSMIDGVTLPYMDFYPQTASLEDGKWVTKPIENTEEEMFEQLSEQIQTILDDVENGTILHEDYETIREQLESIRNEVNKLPSAADKDKLNNIIDSILNLLDKDEGDNEVESPLNLKAVVNSPKQVTISFDSVPNSNEYILKRDGIVIAYLKDTSYVDNNVSPNQTYEYEVIVRKASGESEPSKTTVKTSVQYNEVTITWPLSKDAKGYKVYRGNEVIGETTKNTFTDTEAVEGQNQQYRIEAIYDDNVETPVPVIQNAKAEVVAETSAKISWDNFEGAKRYTVQAYILDTTTGEYVKEGFARMTTTNSLDINTLQKGFSYKFEITPIVNSTLNESASFTNEINL